ASPCQAQKGNLPPAVGPRGRGANRVAGETRGSSLARRQSQPKKDKERAASPGNVAQRARMVGKIATQSGRAHGEKQTPRRSRRDKRKSESDKRPDFRRAVRIDELRKKRQKKQGDFWIEDIGNDAATKGESRGHRVGVARCRHGGRR